MDEYAAPYLAALDSLNAILASRKGKITALEVINVNGHLVGWCRAESNGSTQYGLICQHHLEVAEFEVITAGRESCPFQFAACVTRQMELFVTLCSDPVVSEMVKCFTSPLAAHVLKIIAVLQRVAKNEFAGVQSQWFRADDIARICTGTVDGEFVLADVLELIHPQLYDFKEGLLSPANYGHLKSVARIGPA